MAKNHGTKGKRDRAPRSKQTVEWLREQIEAQHPGFNPVLEMIAIAKKEGRTKEDLATFDLLAQIAPYTQPKLKSVELTGQGEDGELVLRWER